MDVVMLALVWPETPLPEGLKVLRRYRRARVVRQNQDDTDRLVFAGICSGRAKPVSISWEKWRAATKSCSSIRRWFALTTDRFPMLFAQRQLHVGRIDLFGVPKPGKHPTSLPELRQPDETVSSSPTPRRSVRSCTSRRPST